MRVFVWVYHCVSRVYAVDTHEQKMTVLNALIATAQSWAVARSSLDRAYQYSDPERGILYFLRLIEVGSCDEFGYGTGFAEIST